MKISEIMFDSPSNSPVAGERADVIWFSGCSIRCPGCINAGLWDAGTGYNLTPKVVASWVLHGKAKWISLSGGEPAEQPELFELLHLLVGRRNLLLNTGRTYNEVDALGLLKYVEAVKYGPFMQAQKGGWGSLNQKMMVRRKGAFVEWPYAEKKEIVIAGGILVETGYGSLVN